MKYLGSVECGHCKVRAREKYMGDLNPLNPVSLAVALDKR